MLAAELHGKIPSKLDDKEDILTSNVFSFFKYSDRQLLKDYLFHIGINVSLNEAKSALFEFWPVYQDGTEPDLIVHCGKYYILFEAKLYSDFSRKTSKVDSQIVREIRMGKLSSENENKEFVYIAITAEYYKEKSKYNKYENSDFRFIWTNWQAVTSFIEDKLEKKEVNINKDFALDLYDLLVKKSLRSYYGIANLDYNLIRNDLSYLFYNLDTSRFKGTFTGFLDSQREFASIQAGLKIYHKTFFTELKEFTKNTPQNIFYYGN